MLCFKCWNIDAVAYKIIIDELLLLFSNKYCKSISFVQSIEYNNSSIFCNYFVACSNQIRGRYDHGMSKGLGRYYINV